MASSTVSLMTKSVIVWKHITFILYILQPVYTETTYTSKACFGNTGLTCTRHDIKCSSTQKTAIYDAYYTENTQCATVGLANCKTVNPDNLTEHGYHRFNNAELVSLFNSCSTKTQCVYRAPRRGAVLVFSVVKYQCIKKMELLNVSGDVAEGVSQVSLTHGESRRPTSTRETITYVCSFEPDVSDTSISVYVLDARLGRGTACLSQLSVLNGNIITTNNCSTVFQPFERLNVTVELPTSLNFMNIQRSSTSLIWLLINASDPFSVACEPMAAAGTSTGATSSYISSTDDNNHISTGSSRSTDITPTATTRGYIQTTTGDTGAIIGGVVATVVAILVVALVSVWIIRNRRAKIEVKEKTASFPQNVQPDMAYSLAGKIPQNNYHEIHGEDPKTQNSDYDYAIADGMAIPQNANTYIILESAEQQNAKQFSKASTTESDYDHIGDKPSPQTSDYDTTASVAEAAHTRGTIGEDDYGYTLFHKKTISQTHQNDYDTAASATKAVAQLDRTDRNTDDDDYDHFPSVTNHPETVSSPYDTASGMGHISDYSVAEPMQ